MFHSLVKPFFILVTGNRKDQDEVPHHETAFNRISTVCYILVDINAPYLEISTCARQIIKWTISYLLNLCIWDLHQNKKGKLSCLFTTVMLFQLLCLLLHLVLFTYVNLRIEIIS